MYYRVAIRREGDQRDRPPSWQWKSTVLSSLQTLFHFLRLYGALPQDHLRVFSSSSRGSLEEQLAHENKGLSSHSVTAAQFLQERMIRSPEVTRGTSERGARGHQETASIAVSTKTRLNESSRAAYTLDERRMSRLSERRLELELGPGGDHDVPYSFAKTPPLPQVLAWMRLLARVHRGELRP
jgi:hypothetical protein